MAKSILIVDDEPVIPAMVNAALKSDGYEMFAANDFDGSLELLAARPVDLLLTDVVMPQHDGFELIERAHALNPRMRAIVMTGSESPETALSALRHNVCDLLYKPFSIAELRDTVRTALAAPQLCGAVEVLSATPDWLALRVPGEMGAIQPLHRIITRLDPALDTEAREAVGIAFRELMQNAIEHGCQSDPTKFVEVRYVRLHRAVLCHIKDPGLGFSMNGLTHAAISNPDDQPYQHIEVRAEQGLRPGGFGLMLVRQMVDELIYNEQRNEVMFVKYV
jgi:CheY-like chemotaxis protein/anti-sigma regulatory factor (Ser/Thr protein kinase)